MRKQLVELLKKKGISNSAVLHAIGKVPRHLFLDSSFEAFAYQDKPFPIAANQTISQPYTVAFQSQHLDVHPGMRVLEVGTGSGYQAAVLLEMGCKVFTIERQHELFLFAKPLLNGLGYRPVIKYGDGYKGMPAYAPFDRVIVTAAAPQIPEPLLEQLTEGGKMLIPVGEQGDEQRMMELIRKPGKRIETRDLGAFRFVPMLEDRQS